MCDFCGQETDHKYFAKDQRGDMKEILQAITTPSMRKSIKQLITSVQIARRAAAIKVNNTLHHASCFRRGSKEQHLVIVGFQNAGADVLQEMVASVVSDIWTSEDERPVRATRDIYKPRLCTRRPRDLFEIGALETEMTYREFKIVCVVRDPRDIVSITTASLSPFQFSQGVDYSLSESGDAIANDKPGIFAAYEQIRKLMDKSDVLVVRYEDIISRPEQVRAAIARFSAPEGVQASTASADEDVSSDHGKLASHVRKDWTSPGRLERVLSQLALYPELEDIVVGLGYPSTLDLLDSAGIPRDQQRPHYRGTIVAFNTSDPLYTEEARRFKGRLSDLGLDHDVTVVPPREDWVRNCAIKPDIISSARERLEGPLLYTDVDAYFHRDPWPILEQHSNCDCAAFIKPDGELLSGTVLFNDTLAARRLIDEWAQRQRRLNTTWDQRVLQEIILEDEAKPIEEREYRFHRLSPCMTYIFDGIGFDYLYRGPIVEHLQASREFSTKKRGHLGRRHARLKELFSEQKQ